MPGGNKAAVDRLDDPIDATNRNPVATDATAEPAGGGKMVAK